MVCLRPFNILAKLISSERGFSLTEVLIGGGILAGVALAGARMFSDQKTAQKKVQDDQKLSLYHQNIVKQMNIAGNCNATFNAAGLAGGVPLSNGTNISAIRACSSNCVDTNAANQLAHKAIDVVPGPALLTAGAGNYIDDTSIWYPETIRLLTPQSPKTTSGPVTFRVIYRMNPRLAPNKTIQKDIVVNTRFANNVFQECLSGQESSVNNLQNDFCKSLNFNETTSTGVNSGKLAVWDEVTQTCVVGTEKKCNTPGMVVDGLDSTGTIRCRAIVQPGDASSLQQTAPAANCAAPVLVFEGGRIVAKCP